VKSEEEKAKERARLEMDRAQEIVEWKHHFPYTLDEGHFSLVGEATPKVSKPLLKIKLEVYEDIKQERLFHVVLDDRRYEFVPWKFERIVNTFKRARDNNAEMGCLRFSKFDSYTGKQLRFIGDFLVSAWDGLPDPGQIEKWEED
jgi:hypothetical protein